MKLYPEKHEKQVQVLEVWQKKRWKWAKGGVSWDENMQNVVGDGGGDNMAANGKHKLCITAALATLANL